MQPLLEVSVGPSPGWLLVFGFSLAPVSVVEVTKIILAVLKRSDAVKR